MTDFWDTVLNFAETTAVRVGKQLMADFGSASALEKSDGSLVTQSDLWSDLQIRTCIAETFPDHGILAEESAQTFPDNEWCWIVDPLDGTTNFSRGVPVWGISLGLLYRGTPVFGLVHCPPIQQTFHGFWYGSSGLRGPIGAFLNHQPIHPSPDEPSSNHFFSFCSRSLRVVKHPFPCKIRMVGVATYNLLTVASGVALGAVEATPKIWDIAAVWPIVHAAGGVWVFLDSTQDFPLQAGQNYGSCPFPTLTIARSSLVSVFQPLVQSLVSP